MSQQPLDYQSRPPRRGVMSASGIPLFKLFGIQVSLHWMWFLAVFYMIDRGRDGSTALIWNIAEVLSLFAIVLAHEFGHSLACRSVGGVANRILLWPLGGAAFVDPPRRPGAMLWSIVAGPLVNVVLIPITFAAFKLVKTSGIGPPGLADFLNEICDINLGLLIFNMLPIYPLDGGKILWALLWFILGESRSLMVASIIGLVGSAAGLVLAVYFGGGWLVLIAGFAALQAFSGFQASRMMAARERPTQRSNVRCPACAAPPPVGPYWGCPCGKTFDVFEHRGICPHCGGAFTVIPCPRCRQSSAPFAWSTPTTPVAPVAPRQPA